MTEKDYNFLKELEKFLEANELLEKFTELVKNEGDPINNEYGCPLANYLIGYAARKEWISSGSWAWTGDDMRFWEHWNDEWCKHMSINLSKKGNPKNDSINRLGKAYIKVPEPESLKPEDVLKVLEEHEGETAGICFGRSVYEYGKLTRDGDKWVVIDRDFPSDIYEIMTSDVKVIDIDQDNEIMIFYDY